MKTIRLQFLVSQCHLAAEFRLLPNSLFYLTVKCSACLPGVATGLPVAKMQQQDYLLYMTAAPLSSTSDLMHKSSSQKAK